MTKRWSKIRNVISKVVWYSALSKSTEEVKAYADKCARELEEELNNNSVDTAQGKAEISLWKEALGYADSHDYCGRSYVCEMIEARMAKLESRPDNNESREFPSLEECRKHLGEVHHGFNYLQHEYIGLIETMYSFIKLKVSGSS